METSKQPSRQLSPELSEELSQKSAEIQKAATLLLVRDAPAGVEVFMLERPSRGAFPGLHVFTGGKVDLSDDDLVATMDWHGPSEASARELLNSNGGALCYWLAAVRECYEEAGVLLGEQSGRPLDPATVATLAISRSEEFGGLCARLGVTLRLDALHYFAHWVTPEHAPRRFDTRFFVARMPVEQTASFAPGETLSGEWVSPEEALLRAQEGRWNLIMPTLTSLRSLLPYRSVDELLVAVSKFEHLPEHDDYYGSEGMQPGINPISRSGSR